MKKIMFNDRFGLTEAVLSGRKTMTRRIIGQYIEIDWNRRGVVQLPVGGFEHDVLFMDVRQILPDAGRSDYSAPKKYQPKYERGEIIAVAQSYHELNKRGFIAPEWYEHSCEDSAGYENKMFVRADLMPHRIRITDIQLQRLNNISDEDCIREGITKGDFKDFPQQMYFPYKGCKDTEVMWTPQGAFSILIDKICGKGTWDSNPWVYAYTFELLDDKGE